MADSDDSSDEGSPAKASFMGVVLVVMFICLFIGWKTPETVVRYSMKQYFTLYGGQCLLGKFLCKELLLCGILLLARVVADAHDSTSRSHQAFVFFFPTSASPLDHIACSSKPCVAPAP